jgi:copper chaperone
MKKVIFQVEGISCGHCEAAIKKALFALAGVENCTADAKIGEVSINFDETTVNIEKLKNEIIEAGYDVL